jgi:hypothetical protein
MLCRDSRMMAEMSLDMIAMIFFKSLMGAFQKDWLTTFETPPTVSYKHAAPIIKSGDLRKCLISSDDFLIRPSGANCFEHFTTSSSRFPSALVH